MVSSQVSGIYALTLTAVLAVVAARRDMKMVCYYTNWSQYRTHHVAKFMPENIDAKLCTHIMYAFGDVTSGLQLKGYEWNDENTAWSKGMFQRVLDLKSQNNDLKVLLSVGGWNKASKGFEDVVASDYNMDVFVKNAIRFLRKQGFDGLDMDWEYPGVVGKGRGSKPEHKQAFTRLIQKLRAAFEEEGKSNNKARLLITAAVGCGKDTIDAGYEVELLTKEFDFIQLMTYDLHGGWERKTGVQTALYAREDEIGIERFLNIDWIVNYFIEKGLTTNKMVLGLATYGRGFELENLNQRGLGAPAKGPSSPGQYIPEKGFNPYYEICDRAWESTYDIEQQVMYASQGNQWIGYENELTIGIKAKYIKNRGLAGGMIWSLDLDDFKGHCGKGKYPLLKTVVDILFDKSLPITTVEPPVTTIEPSFKTVEPPIKTVEPPITTVEPPITTVEPPVTTVEPPITTVEPPVTNVEPPVTTVEPPVTNVEPPVTTIEPAFTTVEPPITTVEPHLTIFKHLFTTVEDRSKLVGQKRCSYFWERLGVEDSCAGYILCQGKGKGVRKECRDGLHFDTWTRVCNWPFIVHRDDCGVIDPFKSTVQPTIDESDDENYVSEEPTGDKFGPENCFFAGRMVGVKGSCDSYVHCTGFGVGRSYKCAPGLIFNLDSNICDWSYNVYREDCVMFHE